MPVKKDETGRRYVQAGVEVPGTPEEVWRAIATGPGMSSWFVPAEIDGREGGTTTLHFGPGSSMDSVSAISVWDAPRRLVATSDGFGPGAPPVATEWTVEAKAGGTCVVRVVHSWFADTDDWDDQFEGTEHGWAAFFRILASYLAHFEGQPSAVFQLMGQVAAPVQQAWAEFSGRLGLEGAAEGQRIRTKSGAPPLSGVVERVGLPEYPELLIRVDEPGPGLAHLFALPMGDALLLPLRLFWYGERAAGVAAEQEPVWQSWLASWIPPSAPPPA